MEDEVIEPLLPAELGDVAEHWFGCEGIVQAVPLQGKCTDNKKKRLCNFPTIILSEIKKRKSDKI